MNRTLTINTFAARLALMTGMDNEACVEFVKNAFNVISEGLKESSRVKIKGFGEFAVSDRGVDFIADEAVAQRVNDPFSFFEPVEVEAGTTDEELSEQIIESEAQIAINIEKEPSPSPEEDTHETPEEFDNKHETEELPASEEEASDTVEADNQSESSSEAVNAQPHQENRELEEIPAPLSEPTEDTAVDETDEKEEIAAEMGEAAAISTFATEVDPKEEDDTEPSLMKKYPQEIPTSMDNNSVDNNIANTTEKDDNTLDEKPKDVKQEISIRGYGLEISPELNVEQRASDRRMRVVMFLLGLTVGLIIATALMYFLPGFHA